MIGGLPRSVEIAIVGGGVMGASTAYHLAAAGADSVAVFERTEHFEDGATNRCAGGVRYQFATDVNIRLSLQSLPMLERFKDEIGVDPQYRACGYLFVLTDRQDVARFEQHVSLQRSLGIDTKWLTGDDVRERVPLMRFPDALAGTLYERDGLADPNSVLSGYLAKSRQLGVEVHTGVEVHSLAVEDGKVRALTANGERIEVGAVVNAAGPWLAEVGKMAGVDIPVQPIRRQMVTTTPLPALPPDFPFVIDFAQSLYFHREGDGVLTGMSNPDQAPGFDQTLDEAWELAALEAAVERMPMLENAGRLGAWAGLYEVTPDAHPIFGPTPVEGFWVVGGFSGHGFMHGPIAGKLMAEYLLDGEPTSVDVRGLDLARFSEQRLIHEYNVI